MTFQRFEVSTIGGKSETVAVFYDPSDSRSDGIKRMSQSTLTTRIANLKIQAPGYDPSSDEAVLAELRVRNA